MTCDPLGALLSFAVYLAIFLPLERLAALRPQRLLRPALGTDLLFLFGNFLVWTPLIGVCLVAGAAAVELLPLAGLRAAFARQPLWLQLPEALLVSDCAIYWFHRACHRVPCLWRFHRVHHTAVDLDWIAAYREHPLDNLLTRAIENLPLVVLGLPIGAIAGFAAFRGLWALYIHSNIRLSPGPLRFLLGAPSLHHAHHALVDGGGSNFANLDPLMDLLFGTFRDAPAADGAYGIPDEPPRSYLGLIAVPQPGDGRMAAAAGAIALAWRRPKVRAMPSPEPCPRTMS